MCLEGVTGFDTNSSTRCAYFVPETQVCFNQRWLDEVGWGSPQIYPLEHHPLNRPGAIPTIKAWCHAIDSTRSDIKCTHRVAKESQTACQLPMWNPLLSVPFLNVTHHAGCAACGANPTVHLLTFWANAVLTFAVVSRLYRCYENYYIQYHRMLYFIQITPWSTMRHVYSETIGGKVFVRRKHEHWGLLPTFDLDSAANIVAWNKLRLFLQTYELRSGRRLQMSVVYVLMAWLAACAYQGVKAWIRRGDEVIDIETVFVFSTTMMLAVGLSAILFTVSPFLSPSVVHAYSQIAWRAGKMD